MAEVPIDPMNEIVQCNIVTRLIHGYILNELIISKQNLKLSALYFSIFFIRNIYPPHTPSSLRSYV